MTHRKPYYIRGAYPKPVSTVEALALGWAIRRATKANTVIVGHDGTTASVQLEAALTGALAAAGANTVALGSCLTEMVTYAVGTHETEKGLPEFGVMITAGAADPTEAGFKFIGPDCRPLSEDDTAAIYAEMDKAPLEYTPDNIGTLTEHDIELEYVRFLLSILEGYGDWPVDEDHKPFKVVIDSGQGEAARVFLHILNRLNIHDKIEIRVAPQVARASNPSSQERSTLIKTQMEGWDADLGLSWDQDGDRLVAYDGKRRMIPGAYVGAYLGAIVGQRYPNDPQVMDQRCVFPMLNTAIHGKMKAAITLPGAATMKNAMRAGACSFGADMDGHYYFKEFMWSDSGIMAAALLMHMAFLTPVPISDVVDGLSAQFPVLGEDHFDILNPATVMAATKSIIEGVCQTTEVAGELVGRSIDKRSDWRFHMRVHPDLGGLCLTVEGRGGMVALKMIQEKIRQIIYEYGTFAEMPETPQETTLH